MSIKWEPLPAHKLDTLKNSSLDNLIELYNNGFRFDDGNIPSMSFKNTLDIRTFTYPLGIVSLAPTITLNKTSFIPGEQVIVTMCADQSSSVIATIVEPNNLEGYGPKTIAAGTCITATFNVSSTYYNGTYTVYLKNSAGTTLAQQSYTISGALPFPPPLPRISLNKTSFVPGDQVVVTMCASSSSSVIATIVEPTNLVGYGPRTISIGTCIRATFNVTNTYTNGTYVVYLKDSAGTILEQRSYTISGAGGTLPPTTPPPTTQPPTTQPPSSPTITLNKTSFVPGEQAIVTMCASSSSSVIATIVEPTNLIGYGPRTISSGTCITATFNVSSSYPNGTYTVYLKNASGTTLAQKSYTISGASGTPPPTTQPPTTPPPSQSSITLNKTSFVPGEQVIITMCADQSSSAIATIVEPTNLVGYGPRTISAGTCITATFNVSNSYSNGTYTIYLKNSSGITLIQKSYTVSGASGTPPPTTQPPTTQPPTTQPPIQCDHNTEISIPPIGCIPKSYLIYGGVGFVLLMLLKK